MAEIRPEITFFTSVPSPHLGDREAAMSRGETTIPTSGSRINWQLLIAACGFMLTISVALAAGAVPDKGSAQVGNVQAVNRTVKPKPVVLHRPQIMTVVILSSNEEANALRATLADDYTRDDGELVLDPKWTHFAVVESEEQETDLWSMLDGTRADLWEDGIEMQVLDLRD
jgi:hypothetical protein